MTDDTPNFLRQLSSDEYEPLPYREVDLRAIDRTRRKIAEAVRGQRRSRDKHLSTRASTAAGLLALNSEWKDRYYDIPENATVDEHAAVEAFRGNGVVIDVQTHFLAPHALKGWEDYWANNPYKSFMPDWWTEMDDLVAYNVAEYIANIFLESETAVAVLTSGPGLDDSRCLFNDEMMAARAAVNEVAGAGRLLNHAVVHADVKHEVDAMAEWREVYDPVGWKVYTPGRLGDDVSDHGWMLDDKRFGLPFLSRARDVGVRLVCAHKGLNAYINNGSPRDIGPAAKAFPDIAFVIYHSGYELPLPGTPEEGPFTDATTHIGVNRLIQSCRAAGIGKGGNVYAELGTTWFCLVRRPVEAAHVLGKLIAYFGEDNVIWGSDSIWYGSAQPIVDAFRSFQIPDWMCERYGYSRLTKQTKEKILSLNAARVYGIDISAIGAAAKADDLNWARALVQEHKERGFKWLR